VIAAAGDVPGSGTHAQTVDRLLLTTRSVELDDVAVAVGTVPAIDIKLTLLLQEAFRHCKVMAAWGDGTAVPEAAGLHRAWDRRPTS
jgi:catalase